MSCGVALETKLASIGPYIIRVWHWTGTSWQMYDPADCLNSDLTDLVEGEFYSINVSQACTINYVSGSKTFNIPLIAGWNDVVWNPITVGQEAKATIDHIDIQSPIQQGEVIRISVFLKNTGAAGWIRWRSPEVDALSPNKQPEAQYQQPGEMVEHKAYIRAPVALTFNISAEHLSSATGSWVIDDTDQASFSAVGLTHLILTPGEMSLAVNEQKAIKLEAQYSDNSKKDVTNQAIWTSSSNNVAHESAGQVIGIGEGQCTITAQFGGMSISCDVTVSGGVTPPGPGGTSWLVPAGIIAIAVIGIILVKK